MTFQFFQSLVVIVAYHTELSMKVAQLGIIFMLTLVKCHHMKRLAKDSCFDECGLACHARTGIPQIRSTRQLAGELCHRIVEGDAPHNGRFASFVCAAFFQVQQHLEFCYYFFFFCCHSATNTAEALCTKGKQRWWQMVGEWQQGPNSPTPNPSPKGRGAAAHSECAARLGNAVFYAGKRCFLRKKALLSLW